MSGLEMNEIRTLVTLLELRSVTATADHLHVTQPTVSYTLRKLRKHFDDELFVRQGNQLQPTPRAMRLFSPLQEALAQIDSAVSGDEQFDPAICSNEMVLALTSVGEQTFLPTIMAALGGAAPNLHLRVERLAASEVEEALLRGQMDMAISVSLFDARHLWRTKVRPVEYVALTSDRHPLPPTGPGMFDGRRFIRVSARGGHTFPNQALLEHGLMPQVALTVEEFASVPGILEATDLVAFLPRHVSEVFAGWFPSLHISELPWPARGTPVSIYTRAEAALSPAVRWFRDTIVDAVKP